MDAQLSLWQGNDTTIESDAQIALSIRESLRARQLILQVLPPRTVEVVVPKGMRPRIVQTFIHEHREWIRRAGRDLLETYPELQFRPDAIDLPAIDRQVVVTYHRSTGARARFRCSAEALDLFLTGDDFSEIGALLRRWLMQQGREVLKPWLRSVGEEIGLRPARTQIRLQKTRWGSCSSSGSISLNAALLLVPPELVRYLLIHELCHLQFMSHSRRYWQLVQRHEPAFRQLDRRLADCWKQMPAWLTVDGSGSC